MGIERPAEIVHTNRLPDLEPVRVLTVSVADQLDPSCSASTSNDSGNVIR
jgi:hypothetical protein